MHEQADKRRQVIRIKDIAEKAGVSTGTVDRVLHNRGRVSANVREKVLLIAKDLNYEPNILARALVSKRSDKSAAVIPDPVFDEYWSAPREGVRQAERELRQYGLTLHEYLFNPADVDSYKKAASNISDAGYNGVLTAPIFYKESLAFLSQWKREGIVFSLFNTHIPDYGPLSYVGQDSYQSGVLAGKLLHYGMQKAGVFVIAHIDEDVPNSSHLMRKEQGFIDYFAPIAHEGHATLTVNLKNCGDEAAFFGQLDELLNNHETISGIFVTTSRAYAIANYFEKKRIRNIKLIGYDLLKKNQYYLDNGFIQFIINQNPRGQGYYGIYTLVDHLIFQKPVAPLKYLPLDIITRENMHYFIDVDVENMW